MLRRLGIVGLAIPLAAVFAGLIYLSFFGTSEPTFEAAASELARDHTVVRLRDDPPAAMVVPREPPESVIVVVILPDDERHVWSAVRALGLLEHVEGAALAMVPIVGDQTPEQLTELARLPTEFVAVNGVFLAAFAGEPVSLICESGELSPDGWSGVVIVGGPPVECGGLPLLHMADAMESARIVQWMQERK